MTTTEKLEKINSSIKVLNENMLKYKKWKLAFANKGTNKYCLTITLNKKELFCGEFATYGSVMSALDLMIYMFSRELDDINKANKKGGK